MGVLGRGGEATLIVSCVVRLEREIEASVIVSSAKSIPPGC